MIKEYIVELREEEADELMEEHWVGELVRCEDCKHMERLPWLDDGIPAMVCKKHMYTGLRYAEFYCADGERKSDE